MKKIGLLGNPNSGKTTLFNLLTGSTAHVGNWPGVTVDKKSGIYKKTNCEIIDLPGVYSLSPYTDEEVVTRNFIVSEKPDCIINIVDATNLERNLYLTTQILEINVPVVIALNMVDVLKKENITIDLSKLEKELGVYVVEISALKREGIDNLMQKVEKAANEKRMGTSILYKSHLSSLVRKVEESLMLKGCDNALFHAIKLIEKDEIEVLNYPDLTKEIESLKEKIDAKKYDDDFEGMIADERYQFITKNFSKVLSGKKQNASTDKIDKVLTHRIFGIPIFLVIMFFIFHLIFSEDLFFLNALFKLEITNETLINVLTGMGYENEALSGIPSLGVFLQSWMGFLTGSITDFVASFMPSGTWYTGLICDGLLAGLDAIFSFIPQILLLFLFLSILEDSGYMARVAFIMDRAFRKFGISGKAFIPLLMGFGCSVPAMMATKTLDDEKEKDLTIRLAPFFSCAAKSPIWALLACVCGGILGDVFVFIIYLLGILFAALSAIVIKAFSKEKEVPPFIMELPNYHLPQARNVLLHLFEKFKHFIYRASTIIAASIIIIWVLSNFSFAFWEGLVDIENSILASIGKVLKYIFYPLGFTQGADGWKYGVAVVTGLIAKEDVVATLASLGLTDATINLSVASVFSFALYNLFTFPCFAAVSTAKSESSKKGFIVTIIWWLLASYIISFVFYWMITLFSYSIILGVCLCLVLILGFSFVIIRKFKKAV